MFPKQLLSIVVGGWDAKKIDQEEMGERRWNGRGRGDEKGEGEGKKTKSKFTFWDSTVGAFWGFRNRADGLVSIFTKSLMREPRLWVLGRHLICIPLPPLFISVLESYQ